jgi:hypothetical protein
LGGENGKGGWEGIEKKRKKKGKGNGMCGERDWEDFWGIGMGGLWR